MILYVSIQVFLAGWRVNRQNLESKCRILQREQIQHCILVAVVCFGNRTLKLQTDINTAKLRGSFCSTKYFEGQVESHTLLSAASDQPFSAVHSFTLFSSTQLSIPKSWRTSNDIYQLLLRRWFRNLSHYSANNEKRIEEAFRAKPFKFLPVSILPSLVAMIAEHPNL